MSKYRVVFEGDYNKVRVVDTYIVEAKSKKEALELIKDEEGELENTEVQWMTGNAYQEHVSTKKIKEDE